MKTLKLVAAVLAFVIPSMASAGAVYGVVQDVVAETMPNYVAFKLSSMPAGCQPPYAYFAFSSTNPDTVKAVYAMVMAAVLGGKNVWVAYDDYNQCRVTQVHGVY